jgi:hypothetical protein
MRLRSFLLLCSCLFLQAWSPFANLSPASTKPLKSSDFTVRFHPDGYLQVGDQVSIEVFSNTSVNLNDHLLEADLPGPLPVKLGTAKFTLNGLTGRYQAALQWVWDTRSLAPGDYRINLTIQPDGFTWQVVAHLQAPPKNNSPPPKWATAETSCCIIHYITGTAAERDLSKLLPLIQQEADNAEMQMGVVPENKIPINLIPRVIGNGGFTRNEISVSYLDRDYNGAVFSLIIHHEMIHALDQAPRGKIRPTIFIEGLAVYLTGGHYKPEPLATRAAALLHLNRYIPLNILTDQFYQEQHETGYLEAGALVQYLVQTRGWQTFMDFYHNIDPIPNASQSQILDAALRASFGLSLQQLDDQFVHYLSQQPLVPDLCEDVRVTIRLYDTMRQYQQKLDPSAYFESVWLPVEADMRKRGIVADDLRHPDGLVNQLIENELISASMDLREGHFAQAEKTIGAVTIILKNTPALLN